MTFHELLKRSQKLAFDNSPLILTAIGVTGTITTAVLTGKASIKAYQIIDKENTLCETDGLPLPDTKTKIRLVWVEFVPGVISGVGTIACIICANRIGTRRAAAMASALSISEKAFNEYKDKVAEKIGQNKERQVRDDIAQDRVNNNPVGRNEVVVTGGGEVLCYDSWTARYFTSSMETIKKAVNDTNYMILNNFYASLNDFYDKLGLARVKMGDDLGWNSDKILEVSFSTTMSDDNRPCISVDFRTSPISGFSRVH
jgi:hypothetical protein